MTGVDAFSCREAKIVRYENMNTAGTHIILFDGVCNLCNGAVRFVIKRDPAGKFKFASLQSDAGQTLLRQYAIPEDKELKSFIYIRNGKYLKQSSAALQVLRELGGIWKLAAGILGIVPRSWRDFAYNVIARRRYRIFGRKDTCIVPAAGLKQRFLE